jgi:hypothetical protein
MNRRLANRPALRALARPRLCEHGLRSALLAAMPAKGKAHTDRLLRSHLWGWRDVAGRGPVRSSAGLYGSWPWLDVARYLWSVAPRRLASVVAVRTVELNSDPPPCQRFGASSAQRLDGCDAHGVRRCHPCSHNVCLPTPWLRSLMPKVVRYTSTFLYVDQHEHSL